MNSIASNLVGQTTLRRTLSILVALLLVWLALDGVAGFWVGFGFALLAAVVGATLIPAEGRFVRPARLPAFAVFFVIESFRGAIDVAQRAFRPRMGLDLQLVNYPIRLPAGKPRTLLVAVVSLLPGTLSAALRADGNCLLIHSLTGNPEPAVRSLEARIARLFAIDLTDGD